MTRRAITEGHQNCKGIMENAEFGYIVTWDGYSEGREAGFPQRKLCGVTGLDGVTVVVVQHKDSSPRVYRLSAQQEISVDGILLQHKLAYEQKEADRKAALAKLTDHDRKILGV